MTRPGKIPQPLAPELIEKSWSARESWRTLGIMSEFVEAT
ncbi:MAG: TIGR00730 family Rossman fold protein, partial [Betaproteobacteria bacterium]|nr:TIGR00730 family Rossman fold protein [Betaproteobacteria bacterium]